MQKLIITAAVNGGITPRSENPAVPHTPDEIAEAVYQCWNAGASVALIQARTDDGNPSYDQGTWGEIVEKIRARCDIILNLSTSGLNLPSHLADDEAWNGVIRKPEIASFSSRLVFNDDKPRGKTSGQNKDLARAIPARASILELEVDQFLATNKAETLIEDCYDDYHLIFALVMGLQGSLRATSKNLIHLIDSLPKHSIWSVVAISRPQLPLILYAILYGGHVRTALDVDTCFIKGDWAFRTADLVGTIARLSIHLGRSVASTSEAREMLGLSKV